MIEKKYTIFMENIHGNVSDRIQGLDREERRKTDGSVQAMQEFAKWYEINS